MIYRLLILEAGLIASLVAVARPANYDESKVAPYALEDPLKFADGTPLKSVADWPRRRAEIVRIFERGMYGKIPPPPEAVVTELLEEGTTLAGLAIRRQYRMWFKANRTGPFVDWLLVIPNRIRGVKPQLKDGRAICENEGRCPVILMLNYKGNHTVLTDSQVILSPNVWIRPGRKADGDPRPSGSRPDARERGKARQTDEASPIPLETIVARGYALMTACYGQISPDAENRYRDELPADFAYTGVFSLWPRGDTDWETTALGAWGWTLSRGLDLAERLHELDARRSVVTGYSRLAKAALVAASRDERFAICVPNQTGGGGVPLAKRDFGENVAIETRAFPHWFCSAYAKYADREVELPFDQHLLLASIAPRALLVEGFNSEWYDANGEFLACQAAAPVWRFLGWQSMPKVTFPANYSTAAIGEGLGYVRRGGEHGLSGYDWQWILDFADHNLQSSAKIEAVAKTVSAAPCLVPAPRELTMSGGVCRMPAPIVERQDASLPAEGYVLTVSEKAVEIVSSDPAGAFYARETLKQLSEVADGATNCPCCTVRDGPAYRWRGVLIDDCRHFFGRESLENVLDTMAMHKLNVLHWHLTDDQGWRIDIPFLPELAKYGSVRASSPRRGAELQVVGKFRYRSEARDNVPYGPFFYTEADLRHIVAYAAARQITVVPEIDLPGHMRSAIAAYPELTCFPESITNRMAHDEWGVTTDVLCLGKDETVRFLERVFDFVCNVFPSDIIHIGGDECPRLNWEKCPKCRARMKAEGMKAPGDLQAWITRKMADYLAKKGRRIIGWDEMLQGDVPASAIGQSWRTQAGNGAGTELVRRDEAIGRGHDMVISPHTECYYNYKQGLEDDPFQYAGTPLPLEWAYRFDPRAGLPPMARKHVIGSEACLWSEYIWDPSERDWKLWPRGCAMAELLWTDPQPRDFADFQRRMAVHRKRLIKRGVNCAPLR